MWNEIDVTDEPLYDFDLIQHIFKIQHFSKDYLKSRVKLNHLKSLRVMGKFGDSVTTDHISPAGAIGKIHQQENTY